MGDVILERIERDLRTMADEPYRAFQARLIPTIAADRILGVRTPQLRRYARDLARDDEAAEHFLMVLPHRYYEEYNIHGELITRRRKNIDSLIAELDRLLPYVDNWATCDMISPKLFARYPAQAEAAIVRWLHSDHTYTVRFGVVSLLEFFLDERFRAEHLDWVCGVHNDDYYVRMAVAWYVSVALVKQWDMAIGVLNSGRLERDVHNKAIQKAVESFRISDERKALLRSLRRR